MNWKQFLQSKGISEEDYAKKSVEEMAKLQSEYQEAVTKELNDKIAKASTKEEVEAVKTSFETYKAELEGLKIEESFKELTEKVNQLLENQNGGEDKKEPLSKQLKDNMDEIKKIASGSSTKEIVVKADTLRANIASNTQSYNLPDIGQLAHRKLTLYDIFPKFPISESNNNGTIRYWDWDAATIARSAATRAEGAAFPESTAKWVLGTIPVEKIGDTLPVSAEFYEDEAMFAAELNHFLETNVAIEVDNQLGTGNGTTPNLKGIVATVGNYTPAAAGITDANIYDLLVKVSESITTTGGSKYMPDFVLMNIADINKMKLKKDANNNYIIPPFVSRDGKQVDSIVVMESNVITANTAVVGDRRYARIYEKGGVVLSKGLVANQFIEDMETIKARKRMAFLIRGADLGGFANITSISAALTTLAS